MFIWLTHPGHTSSLRESGRGLKQELESETGEEEAACWLPLAHAQLAFSDSHAPLPRVGASLSGQGPPTPISYHNGHTHWPVQ